MKIKSKFKLHWKEKWGLSNIHCNLHVLKPSQYYSDNFGLFWPERIKVFLFWQGWQMLWLMIAKIRSFSLRNVTTWFAYKQGVRQALENLLHLQILTLEMNKRNFIPWAQRMLSNNDIVINIGLKLQIMKVKPGDFCLFPPRQALPTLSQLLTIQEH